MDYYQKLLPTYKNGILFVQMFCVEGTIWESSKDSSLAIFNAVNKERETLRKEGHYFISAFGAGSCKACDTCSVPCSAPENSIVPLEATGINVVLLAEKFGIKIVFPVGRDFYRLGALFYD
jgi:predicted metal-binding protein